MTEPTIYISRVDIFQIQLFKSSQIYRLQSDVI